MTHRTEIKVRGYHLDLYQHVNNARYLEFMEEARWRFFEEYGDLPRFLSSGLALIVVNINIDYRRAAAMNEVLSIETELEDIRRRSVVIRQRIKLAGDGTLITDAAVTFVIVDPKQNKAVPLEGDLKALLDEMLTRQESETATG